MIRIPREIFKEIEKKAEKAFPVEACGLLVGRGDTIRAFFSSPNRASDPEHEFLIDPDLHLKTQRRMRKEGLEILGVYHSHPSGDSRPSGRDLKTGGASGFLWLIIPVVGGKAGKSRIFRQTGRKNQGFNDSFREESLLFSESVE